MLDIRTFIYTCTHMYFYVISNYSFSILDFFLGTKEIFYDYLVLTCQN